MEQDLIDKLVKASGVQEGELVLVHFWGEDSEKKIANGFLRAVAALGASPVLLQQSRTVNRDLFQSAKETSFPPEYFQRLESFDAVLDVFTYQPVILGYEIEAEQFDLYRCYMARLFEALMKAKRFTQIRMPTEANAAESNLDPADYMERMTRAYDIEYEALKTACRERIPQEMQYILRTGEGCELHFDLSGRAWHVDAGDGDLPCGEVYIAPVEEVTNGKVYFEKLYLKDVGVFSNVTLTVRDGVVSGSNWEEINEFLKQQPRENKVVSELGFGMNPNVTDLCGYTVLDEKMTGTFHIAIGANHMFGGQNRTNLHLDMVGKEET